MEYGFEARNSGDNSLVISADADNAFYVGYVWPYDYDAPRISGGITYFRYRFFYELPVYDQNTVPIIFIPSPGGNDSWYNIETFKWNSEKGQWVVVITTNDNGVSIVYGEIHVFLGSNDITRTATGSYGLQLKNSSGEVTFDSRWDTKLLTVKQIIQTTASPANSYAYNSSIVRPGFMYSSKYVRSYWNGSTQYYWSLGVKMDAGYLNFSEIETVSLYDWPNPYTGTDGDNDNQIIPIIDCNDYLVYT